MALSSQSAAVTRCILMNRDVCLTLLQALTQETNS